MTREMNRICFENETIVGETFANEKFHDFDARGTHFKDCTFTNVSMAQMFVGPPATPCTFTNCTFDRLKVKSPFISALFDECTFTKCQLTEFNIHAGGLKNCTFTGRIRQTVFFGTVDKLTAKDLPEDAPHTITFTGNDFSQCELHDVSFRHGIDLTANTLPTGENYLRIRNITDGALQRALVKLAHHPPEYGLSQAICLIGRALQGFDPRQDEAFYNLASYGWPPEVIGILRDAFGDDAYPVNEPAPKKDNS